MESREPLPPPPVNAELKVDILTRMCGAGFELRALLPRAAEYDASLTAPEEVPEETEQQEVREVVSVEAEHAEVRSLPHVVAECGWGINMLGAVPLLLAKEANPRLPLDRRGIQAGQKTRPRNRLR